MPAITFFTFLNEAYSLDALSRLNMTTVTAYPKYEKEDRENTLDTLIKQTQTGFDLVDDLNYEDYDGINELKGIFDGNV